MPELELKPGVRVEVTGRGSPYKGDKGRVDRLTKKMVYVVLDSDGEEHRLWQDSCTRIGDDQPPLPPAQLAQPPPLSPCSKDFKKGDRIKVTGGIYILPGTCRPRLSPRTP